VSVASQSEGIARILAPVLHITPDLGFEKCGVVDAAISLSNLSDKHVVSIGDGVAKSALLVTVPGAVVAKEVCDFLATLTAAYHGSAID
jgi:hypothetical protein